MHLKLPAPVACNDTLCGFCKARCAYGNLPKFAVSDIGDIMINDTKHSWTVSTLEHVPRKNKAMRNDFFWAMVKSRQDKKRGILGGAANGLLSLKFNNMDNCMIFIFDASYGFRKPPNIANWFLELITRVNGKICREPQCHVPRGNILIIDARTCLWQLQG